MADANVKKLEFSLDPKSGVPFYKQIILQIEMAIADGRLMKGEQLPTVRGLAVDLRINPNTVARAYN
ncbi:MAG: GntR family transcriptional regulator, partial [Spirochaetota bacterium]|nr:GntR family transcriptional regulator [Spirochaetota bacterium]